MVLIHGTNILVDDFDYKRPNRSSYIYFLTHFHYDYYKGLNQKWSDEKIYCSNITRNLLLEKFPNLTNVEALELGETSHIIFLDKDEIYVDVFLFDANHCIGSIMILFTGYMGTILHTGDFRYSKKMPTELQALYPEKKRNSRNEGVSIHIDELILDATYCDPMFVFPKRNDAFNELVRIIDENEGKKFCIVTDIVGKEELMVHLASKYKIKILVDKKKLDIINLAEYYEESFTDNPERADSTKFIQGISRSEIKQKLSEGCVVFVPTGLCNSPSIEIETNYYAIGYSLHSNFNELTDFLKSIKPAKLSISHKTQQNKLPREKLANSKLNQFQRLKATKLNGLQNLALKFCDQTKLSGEYRSLLDINILSSIQQELGLVQSSKKSKSKNQKKKKNNNGLREREEVVLDAVEIEDAGFFEELEEDSDEDEEGNQTSGQKVINLEEEEDQNVEQDETWKSMYQNDRQKFGEKTKSDLTEEEQHILNLLEQQPEDYIPFSDTSDRGDDEEDIDSEPEEDAEMEIVSHKSSEEEEKEEAESQQQSMNEEMPEYPLLKNTKQSAQKLYSGVLTLTVTIKDKDETSEIKEEFALYTNQKVNKKIRFPKDMKFQNTKPFNEVASLIRESLKPRDYNLEYKRSFVTGWVETTRNDDLIFTKLAEHMERKKIVRYYEIDHRATIYFLAPNQVNKEINRGAPMIFVLAVTRD